MNIILTTIYILLSVSLHQFIYVSIHMLSDTKGEEL